MLFRDGEYYDIDLKSRRYCAWEYYQAIETINWHSNWINFLKTKLRGIISENQNYTRIS